MKKTTMIALLSCCVSVLAVVSADTRPAFASDGVTAEYAASEGTREAMEDFLRNVRDDLRELEANNAVQVEFRNTLRRNDGVYRHNDTYSIIVNQAGSDLKSGELIYFHAGYRTATSGSLRKPGGIFEQLMTLVDRAGEDEVVCVKDDGTHGNHICAGKGIIRGESGGAQVPTIVVVGFHNEFSEVDFSRIDCSQFTSEYLQSRGWLPADMVTDEESLVRYLKGVEEHIGEEIGNIIFPALQPILRTDPTLQKPESRQKLAEAAGLAGERTTELQHCWRQEPWTSDSIYFYMIIYGLNEDGIEDGTIQYGVYNGLTAEYHDRNFRLYDGCLNVGRNVYEEVNKQDDTPNEGFITYYWDDPVKEGDEVTDDNGNPIEGLSPGTSVKRGYFKRTNFIQGSSTYYVLGSGIYPEGETYYVPESGECEPPPDTLPESSHEHLSKFPTPPEDDGGCAIASGSGNSLKIAAFNLFLITAVLFLAVSRRSSLDKKFRL